MCTDLTLLLVSFSQGLHDETFFLPRKLERLIFRASTMQKSNDCFFSMDTLFFEKPSRTENFPDNEKSSSWFLPPAPLISEIPDTQVLEEEIESHKLLGQEKKPKELTSNLKITKEDTNYISPMQNFQFGFPSNKYEDDNLYIGRAHNNDLPHVAGKLTYGSQKYKNYIGTETAPETNVLGDTKLINFADNKRESTSAFQKRLFKTSDNIHGSANLNSHIDSVNIVQTKVNKGKSWNISNNKQKHQYSDINLFTASDAFSASDIREGVLKAPSFSVASWSHTTQGMIEKDLGSLKPVTEIPAKFRSIFKEFPYFNYIQSKAFDDLLYTDRNFVISAPTGSGKTVVFELAITRLLMEVPLPWLSIKVVYMAPIKALCSQRFDDWKEKFGPIGLNCKELTGDTVMDDLFEIQHAHIIMTTPVHIVKDENRGPTLEVVVSRMKTIQSLSQILDNTSTIIPMRFIAVSATIPNAEDVSYNFNLSLHNFSIFNKLCLKNLNDLSSLKLINMNEDEFKPTEIGRLMAWYYITFETVKKFCAISGKETLSDLVTMIASCKEFLDVQLRISEKKTLNILNKDPNRITIRFPMEGKIKTREMKINCLIQAHLGCIPIQDFSLTQDTAKIFRNGSRITRWLSDFLAAQENNFAVLLNSLILAKCFRCKLWENSLHVSKQLEKIGITLSNAMVNAGLTSFKKIEETDARELELILSRHPPFGTQIKETVMHLPKYQLEVEQITRYSDTVAEILVTIILRNFEQLRTKRTAPDSHYVTLIIGNADNQVTFKHKIMDSVLLKAGNWTKKINVKRALISDDLSIHLLSSEYAGLDIQQKFTVFYLGPKKFGNQITMQRKSETEISHPKHLDKSVAEPNKGMTAYKKLGKRECNHHCKNKHTCGHDCCKIGVTQKLEMKDPTISSYLSDLRNRNAVSSLPPVKRLKMQMNKPQSVDVQEFSFTPKSSLPSISRSEYSNAFKSHIMEQWDQSEICGKYHQQEPSEYQNKEILDVNFELGNEVWDDFDDENLVEVTNFLIEADKTKTSGFGNTLSSSTRGNKQTLQESKSQFQREMSKSFLSSHDESDIYLSNSATSKLSTSSMMKLPLEAGNTNIVHFQETKQQSLSPEIKKLYFTHSENKSNSSKFTKKMDFFIRQNECKKEIDFNRYHPNEATDEMKSYLGIFDDIF
ncbi:PREDICTED: probable ATP-dependent DNA helicase HFM1 [Chrysochloris asiatica]|uniref:Probable ATP-dependent DNA helicase HFM1 n=1 Tax=Chrysochloris asiatica TaxID=185453 RepID=A0A9B0WG89_CHRAS|nr:PREDICTED: probable ATP-dependent DNA helicase HFM1 [Chrysochloris asiatica]